MSGRRLVLMVGAFAAVVVATFASPPAATAQTACWQRVLAAWSYGRLGPNYPIDCYASALHHLPADVRGYSTAADDIQRTLLAAIKATPKRSTAAHHSTAAPRTQNLLGVAPHVRSGNRLLLPPPLLILAGCCIAIAAVAAFRVRRGTRRH